MNAVRTILLSQPLSLAVTLVVAFLCVSCPTSGQQFEWQTATPESQGLSGPKLDALKDQLAQRKTRALLVIRNDTIVYEWYAAGNTPAVT